MIRPLQIITAIHIVIFVSCGIVRSQDFSNLSVDQIFSSIELMEEENQARIDAAFASMEEVRNSGAYIESLSDIIDKDGITLPVGIMNGEYELIIHNIRYDKSAGKPLIYATCAFEFKEDGQRIAFGGTIGIEGKKGLGTTGFLELISPVKRDLGTQASIIFKSGTRAYFGCDGIESYHARIDLIVTSDKIFAVDNNGNPSGKPLSSSFDAYFNDFDDYSVSFSFNQSFSFRGLNDLIFNLKGANLDQSDMETSALVRFPENYFVNNSAQEVALWKGIAITEASVVLPSVFKRSSILQDSASMADHGNSSEFKDRLELALSNVLIDENGFSGFVSAENIMNSNAIDLSQWDITVNGFMINVVKNDLVGFGFGGHLNIPPFGENSLLPYTATFNPAISEYEFRVNISGSYDFPVLSSTLSLNETSTINILFKDYDIYPVINASGFISIDAPLGNAENAEDAENAKKLSVTDIAFENMTITRDEPYVSIGAIGLSGTFKSPEVAGFELSITDISPFSDENGRGIAFVSGVKLNDMFRGAGGLKMYGDFSSWRFDRVALDKVFVDYKSNAFALSGAVIFENGNELYGTGFRGDVGLTLIDKFNLDAIAVFGRKDDYRYFFTDVLYETSPTAGIPAGPISFYGFGGGLYRKMNQTVQGSASTAFGQSLSGIHYVPDSDTGMGFMTSTKFGMTGLSTAFNARVGFEMQFNSHGGVNFVQLRGDAAFMNDPLNLGTMAENINNQVSKLEYKKGNFEIAAKSDLKVPENKSAGALTASMNVRYDIAAKTFNADLSTYLNAGFIRGIGENDRMGWASAHFSPGTWYTYIGTPTDRLGIEIAGLAHADAYFMAGDNIPELPLPPQKVLNNFSTQQLSRLNKRSTYELATGKGLAFGASLGVELNARLTPFYAYLGVGLGAEFLLKNYGVEAYCAGSNSSVGINGWYARAQAWAWVEADIGIEAKIFSRTRRFSILDMSASTLLAGAGPNPFYFSGTVGGRFSVMGGLISGQCDFDFEIGEECQIITGGSPFGEDIIAQLTPSSGEKDVNVFAAPQAVFNIPVDLEMEIHDDNGKSSWYKITLEEFSISHKNTGQKIEGYTELSQDGKIYMIDPYEPFESQQDMIVYAKVGFRQKINGHWVSIKGSDGKAVYEVKEIEFKSGDRPKEILPEHVKYSYPIARQYNYYPEEYDKGYILVSENYSYLFTTDKPEGFDQKIRISDSNENSRETTFTFKSNTAKNEIRLEINFSTNDVNFQNNEIYKLAIMNIPTHKNADISSNIVTTTRNLDDGGTMQVAETKAEGTLEALDEKEIYSLHFRTSKYNTLAEKINNFNVDESFREFVELSVYNLSINIPGIDFFDPNELKTGNNDPALVRYTALLENTDWFKNSIYDYIYSNITSDAPPAGEFYVRQWNSSKILTQEEIQVGSATGTTEGGGLVYAIPSYCSWDFFQAKNSVSLKRSNGFSLTRKELELLNTDFPPIITQGLYPVEIKYVLPGKNITTSTFTMEIYNEEEFN